MKTLKSRLTYNSRLHHNEEFDKFLFCKEKFSEEGRLLELTEFDEDGNVVLYEKREYHEGNLVKIHTINYVFDTEQYSEYVYKAHLLVEETEYYSDSKYITSKIMYDKVGRVISIQKEDENKLFCGETKTEYLANVKIEKEYDETGKIVLEEEWLYNDNATKDEVLTTVYYYEKTKLISKEVTKGIFTYSGDNILKEEYQTDGVVIYTKEFIYDSEGNMVEYRLANREVSHTEISTYKYNSARYEVLAIQYWNDKAVYSRESKYDNNNMVVECVEKHLGEDDYVSVYKQNFQNECW